MSSWNKGIKWIKRNEEQGFAMEVSQHSFRTEQEQTDWNCQPHVWCTYLLFGDRLRWYKDGKPCKHVEQDALTSYLWENRDALNGIEGWNGSPTFAEFLTDENGCRRIKIGDDYAHLWDVEGRRFDIYDLEYMQSRIERVAREAHEMLCRATNQQEPLKDQT